MSTARYIKTKTRKGAQAKHNPTYTVSILLEIVLHPPLNPNAKPISLQNRHKPANLSIYPNQTGGISKTARIASLLPHIKASGPFYSISE